MRKIIPLALCFMIVCLLTACGTNNNTTKPTESGDTNITTEPTVPTEAETTEPIVDTPVVVEGILWHNNSWTSAREIYEFLLNRGENNFAVLADDSGLEVDYLNGAPGVYSARYAGEHGNDSKNNEKLLHELKNAKGEERKGRFVCAIALVNIDGKTNVVRGVAEGIILEELSGEGGFGYDPLFYYEPAKKTFASNSANVFFAGS